VVIKKLKYLIAARKHKPQMKNERRKIYEKEEDCSFVVVHSIGVPDGVQ